MGIRVDRCGCLRRPLRMSAPTDTDVCVDRYGCLRRPMRMSASTDADGKICGGGGEEGVWEVCEGRVRGAWRGAWRVCQNYRIVMNG